MARDLVQMGVDLPCTVTIDGGLLHLTVKASRASITYQENTPDEAHKQSSGQ